MTMPPDRPLTNPEGEREPDDELAPDPKPDDRHAPDPTPDDGLAPDPEPAARGDREPGRSRMTHRARRRWMLAGAVALIAIGLVGGGAGLGWWAAGRQVAATPPDPMPSVVEVEAAPSGAAEAVTMPDIRGLDEPTARQVLADVGIPAGAVDTTTREAAGAAGLVIEQDPVFGTSRPAKVALVLSARATVPAIEGRSATDVIGDIEALGGQVVTSATYRAGAKGGAILAIEPAPGKPLPETVTMTLAEPAASVYLDSLDTVAGSCSSGERQGNGVDYAHALTCQATGDGERTDWILARVVDSVEGKLAIPDDARPGSLVRVALSADGKQVATADVGYGKTVTLKASVTGALRLALTARVLKDGADQEEGGDSVGSVDLLLGDVRLVGGAEPMTKLGQEQ